MALKDYIESDLSNVDHAMGTGEAARMAGEDAVGAVSHRVSIARRVRLDAVWCGRSLFVSSLMI
jgi:hypothetical protein